MSPLTTVQLIQHVLRHASPSQRLALLMRAKEALTKHLRLLADFRLACSEQGWEDYWRERHVRTTENLAAIEQALATC
jgi:hypothetical protein